MTSERKMKRERLVVLGAPAYGKNGRYEMTFMGQEFFGLKA